MTHICKCSYQCQCQRQFKSNSTTILGTGFKNGDEWVILSLYWVGSQRGEGAAKNMAVEDENSLNWGLHFGMPSLSLSLLMLVAIEKGRLQDEVSLDAKTRPCRLWQLPAGQAFALTLNISRGNHWQWTMMMIVIMIMMMVERVRNWGGKKKTS